MHSQGDEDEDLDSQVCRDEEIGENDEKETEEEDEATEEATGFNGDECLES